MADRTQLLEYLGNKCAHCSKTVDEMIRRYGGVHRIFKFHHVDPANKAGDYENLIRRNISSETLDEIDKCVLLCGECHDILHAQSIEGRMKLVVKIDGRTAEQTIAGNVIVDAVDKELTFLSNEHIYVTPYLMQLGQNAGRELVFGTELNNGKMLTQLSMLRKAKVFMLFSCVDRRKVFQATLTERNSVQIEYDVRLPLPIKIDPASDNNEQVKGWVRNGVALRSDGLVIKSGIISVDLTHPAFL